MADPGRLACLDAIRRILGVRVRWAVAAPDTIAAAIEAAEQITLRLAEINDAETVDAEELDDDRVVELGSPDEPLAHTGSLEIQDSERRPVLGSFLLRDGLVAEAELDAALAQQRLSSTRRLGEILVARGALGEDDVSRALAEQHELPFVELSEHDIDPAAAALLPVELVRRHSALPISYLADGSVLVVVADPTSSIHDEQLRADLGVSVQYAVAAARQIEIAIAIASAFEAEPPADTERPSVALVPALAESDEQVESEAGEDQDAAAGVLASIMQALSLGATAIHFEPRSSGMVISGRIDGNLRELATLPNGDPVTNELGRLVGVDLTHVSRTLQQRTADLVPGRLGPPAGCRPSDDSWCTSHSPNRRQSVTGAVSLRARSRHIPA